MSSRVSPCTSLVLQPLPACFTTEQNTVKASLFGKCWSHAIGINAFRDRMCPPAKLGNTVFPQISAHAQISAHQLSQKSNMRPPRITPPLNQFQISREINKTWFYCQFIHNLKRQRNHRRITVSLLCQLFLSPYACRVPLCVLSVLLNFVILLRSWQMRNLLRHIQTILWPSRTSNFKHYWVIGMCLKEVVD